MINDIKKISLEAGNIIRDGFGKKFSIEYKSNESNLVTEIDKKSEKLITDFITQNYPSHSILAEESGKTNRNSEFTWVVDPLDGTTNFAHGLPIFAVSIGVQRNGETIAGAVYDVMSNNLYTAEKGGGSFCNDSPIKVTSQEILEHSLLVTGFPYDISQNPENALELFSKLTQKARGIRRLGSAAIDFCYVAKGVFDAFWEVNLHPWDICAGKLIVEEAGGKVTDFKGNSTPISTPQILCTNSALHERMIHELSS